MSNYNFDKLTDRTNIYSLKWDIKENELPMWVADMDFEVCKEIVDTLYTRLQKPTFGYNIIPNSWYNAYISWWQKRHHVTFEKDWLMFSTGVVPSISSIVRRLTLPGEKVLIQTPVYNIFFNSILNNGRNVIENQLVYKNNKYSIDFKDLEKKLSDPQVSLMILCNPHNPIGKNWDKNTLNRIGELCKKYNVVVISDEIHCDIQTPEHEYTPFISVSETCKNNSITLIAPTKAFNLAGLQTSAIVIPNPLLRHKVWRGINNDEIAEPNTFAIDAAVSAFTKGEIWLEEMNAYVQENRIYVKEFLEKYIKEITLVPSEATYLLWIDCKNICEDSIALTEYIRKETGLYLSDGREYGLAGKSFIRMNIACPKERLIDGLNRLNKGIKKHQKRA